jgi:predicted RNase H-like nuclease
VHPELSFRALVGQPMTYPKRSWNGQHERRAALKGAGVALEDYIDGAGSVVPPDDLLDAAIAAWSADRLARGLAESIPDARTRPARRPRRSGGSRWSR